MSVKVVMCVVVVVLLGVFVDMVNDVINIVWFLVIDVINKFNFGYFGLLMGCVLMGYVIFCEVMMYNLKNMKWFNCDWFVLFVGYGCML